MTTEEKAKAYDEALERARANYKADKEMGFLENCDMLELIFPELKESEDERIRTIILKLVLGMRDEIFTTADKLVTKPKVLAWLEKQKEPLPIPDKFSGLKSLMLQYLQSAANRKDDVEIESDTDLWGRKILDYVWKYSEKQKEQKPAEWSEEDEQEYTDNDAVRRQSTIQVLEYAKSLDAYNQYGKKDISKDIAWLKSIRPQPKRNCKDCAMFLNGECTKPSWKPSEEQMEALRKAVNKLAKSDVADSVRLSIMYDNLKKLM